MEKRRAKYHLHSTADFFVCNTSHRPVLVSSWFVCSRQIKRDIICPFCACIGEALTDSLLNFDGIILRAFHSLIHQLLIRRHANNQQEKSQNITFLTIILV